MVIYRQFCGTPRRQTRLNDNSVNVVVTHTGKRGVELISAAQYYWLDPDASGVATELNMFEEGFGKWIGSIAQRGNLRARVVSRLVV